MPDMHDLLRYTLFYLCTLFILIHSLLYGRRKILYSCTPLRKDDNFHVLMGILVVAIAGNTILTTPHFAPAPTGYGLYGPPPPPPTMLARPPPPSPLTPTFATPAFTPVLYWACPSPPVSPPHQPALVIMQNSPPPPPPAFAGHHDVSNLIHSVSDVSTFEVKLF